MPFFFFFYFTQVFSNDSAIFYSLLESCDIVGLNPQEWLTDVLTTLRDDTPPEEIEQMLPYYYKKSCE